MILKWIKTAFKLTTSVACVSFPHCMHFLYKKKKKILNKPENEGKYSDISGWLPFILAVSIYTGVTKLFALMFLIALTYLFASWLMAPIMKNVLWGSAFTCAEIQLLQAKVISFILCSTSFYLS